MLALLKDLFLGHLGKYDDRQTDIYNCIDQAGWNPSYFGGVGFGLPIESESFYYFYHVRKFDFCCWKQLSACSRFIYKSKKKRSVILWTKKKFQM